MLKNYLLIAFRNLKRNKVFSLINILCLSLGITFAMLIGVYILQERNVNAGLKNADRQFLVKSKWKVKNMGLDITTVGPLVKAAREQYPNLVANYYRFNPVTNVVSAGDHFFKEDIAIGDTSLISMYGFELLHGDSKRAFHDNNSAVISENLAMKLFGKTDVINQRISLQTLVNNEKQDFLVSAVVKTMPRNSVTGLIGETYDLFVPFEGSRYYQGGDPSVTWNDSYEVSFLELQAGVKPEDLKAPLQELLAKNAPKPIHENLEVELVPLRSYYLKDNNGAAGKMILTLSLVGLFILVMAVINFVNISIGTSSTRLKEIGLRKVLGGQRRQLILQFLAESILLTTLAALISLAGYIALRPVFNQLLNTTIPSLGEFGVRYLAYFILFILLLGIIAGLYPAFVLSASGIAFAVKGKLATAGSGAILRKSLLVVQFSMTIIVFIGALAVSRQVKHIFNKDLGYNKEQLLVITAFPKQWDTVGVQRMLNIKRQLLEVPDVQNATIAFEIPNRKPPATMSLLPVDGRSNQPLNIPTISADEDYAATYEMNMVSGSFFNHGKTFTPGQIVLNETAARSLGLDPNNATGRQISFPASTGSPVTVAGVVRDYNYSNIQEGIEPMAFMHINDFLSYRYMTVRLKPGNMSKAVEAVRKAWKQASPNSPFDFVFMDDNFESLYRSELKLEKASNVATILNLLIVLMGVFGVVTFTLAKRTKEIAVRKVLGANSRNIMEIFLREYGMTIAIANIIAWPLAYLVVDNWLQNYQYRVQQDLFTYLLVAVCVFGFAFSMIIAQCLKSARANPVGALRSE